MKALATGAAVLAALSLAAPAAGATTTTRFQHCSGTIQMGGGVTATRIGAHRLPCWQAKRYVEDLPRTWKCSGNDTFENGTVYCWNRADTKHIRFYLSYPWNS